jgi:2-polyprenyl-3-methyl-5-hydroxy-6-metoxy-1,4-benzoquinol methylase
MSFERETGRDRVFEKMAVELTALVDPETGKVRADLVQRISCPLCDGNSHEVLFTKYGFDFVRCSDCSLIYVNPQLVTDEVTHYYFGDNDSSATEWLKVLLNPKDQEWRRASFYDALDSLHPFVPGGRLLDIGCSIGLFMDTAAERGYECMGIELEKEAWTYATNHGYTVARKTLHAAAFASESFDVVSMFGVLEHLPDPGRILSEVHRILKPGGAVIIVVPNTYSMLNMVLHERARTFNGRNHLTYFSETTLERMLSKYGFSTVFNDTFVPALDSLVNYLQFANPFGTNTNQYLPQQLRNVVSNSEKRKSVERLVLDLGLGTRLRFIARR